MRRKRHTPEQVVRKLREAEGGPGTGGSPHAPPQLLQSFPRRSAARTQSRSWIQLRVEVGPMRRASRLRVVSCAAHGDSGTFDVGAEFVGNELETLARRELAA